MSSGHLFFPVLAKMSFGLTVVSKMQCLCLRSIFYKIASKSEIRRCLISCSIGDNALSYHPAAFSLTIPTSRSRASSVAEIELTIGHIRVRCRFSVLGTARSGSLAEVRLLRIHNPTYDWGYPVAVFPTDK